MEKYIKITKFTSRQKLYMKIKRCLDVIMAILLLILFSPILLISIAWVRVESPGPAIFKQMRPGYLQLIFPIYKLRTMRVEVEKDGKSLTDQERMTKSGRFLRKTSIDELPQLFNVLKGEMSLVGPRPERPFFVDKFIIL